MKRLPYLKFFTADWRSEPRLKMVSRAARSLWIDIICLIHESGTGRLEIDGRNPSDKDLAAILGDNPRTVRKLLSELENAGVFSRDEQQFVISRRIIRDRIKAERDANNGRKGGNPALKTAKNASEGVNPHIPEAIFHSPDIPPINTPPTDFDRFWEAYPRRTAKAKAWQAYTKALKRTDPETILAGVARYVASVEAERRDGFPDLSFAHPTTWLNQGRWDDEPYQPKGRSNGSWTDTFVEVYGELRSGQGQGDSPDVRALGTPEDGRGAAEGSYPRLHFDGATALARSD